MVEESEYSAVAAPTGAGAVHVVADLVAVVVVGSVASAADADAVAAALVDAVAVVVAVAAGGAFGEVAVGSDLFLLVITLPSYYLRHLFPWSEVN